jgi:hypothetical protein
MTQHCTICGDHLDRTRGARGDRCRTCDTYRRRRGTDRPDDLVVKQTQRDIERASKRCGR